MFLNKKLTFKIPGYDTIRNDRSTGQKEGVAFLVKHGLVINKEYRNSDFNIITDNEAFAINLELSNNQNLTLATIYCPMEILTFHFFNIITAVDKAIPASKRVRPESNPISNETLALIKEKHRLRRQYSQKKDPAVKTRINQLQKQVKEELKVESLVSWEKFCNSISLENNPMSLGAKLRTSLSRRVSVTIQLCTMRTKSPRPTLIKRISLPNLLRDISA